MRIIIVFLSLFLLSKGNAQVTLTKTSCQQWAGGVCCSYGANYSIMLSMPKSTYQSLELRSVCMDGREYENAEINKEIIDQDTLVYVRLSFSYSITARGREIDPEKIIEVDKNPCPTNGIHYVIGTTVGYLPIEKIDEWSMIAYP